MPLPGRISGHERGATQRSPRDVVRGGRREPDVPAGSDPRALTCRSRTDFRFGWEDNAEHRRFMTEPPHSRHSERILKARCGSAMRR